MPDPVIIEHSDSRLRTSDGYVARFSRGHISGLIIAEITTPSGAKIATGSSTLDDALSWSEREIEIDRQNAQGLR